MLARATKVVFNLRSLIEPEPGNVFVIGDN
jgi:hypothetical protein